MILIVEFLRYTFCLFAQGSQSRLSKIVG